MYVVFLIVLNIEIIWKLVNVQEALYYKDVLIYSVVYLISIILIIKNTPNSKKAGWSLSIAASLWVLLNPTTIIGSDYASGALISFIQSLLSRDSVTALFQLIRSLVPFSIIIFSVTELFKYRRYEKIMMVIFTLFFGLSLLFYPIVAGGTYVRPLIICILYTGLLVLWNRIEKGLIH